MSICDTNLTIDSKGTHRNVKQLARWAKISIIVIQNVAGAHTILNFDSWWFRIKELPISSANTAPMPPAYDSSQDTLVAPSNFV
jgi:hypothetical protein